MVTLLNVLLIYMVYFVSIINATDVKKCTGTSEVSITDCTAPPCPLKRGEKVWMNMTFTSDDDYPKVKTSVTAMMLGIKTGWPGSDGQNACDYISPPCPLKKGETYKLATELEVKKSFPKVSVLMHFGVKGNNGKEPGCYDCPVKVV